MSEEMRRIKRVGHYSTSQAQPCDCLMCKNAVFGTVLIDGICLGCRDLLMLHGNWAQAEIYLSEYRKFHYNDEEIIQLLEGCLPQPPATELDLSGTSFDDRNPQP